MTTPPNRRIHLFVLALLLLFSGIALLPLSGLSAEKIHWVNVAQLYDPDLEILSEDDGAPGSAFFLRGERFPPNTLATIYVDGQPKCTVMTNTAGVAEFIIQTSPNDPLGEYDITLSTSPNLSDTDDVELEDDEPLIAPPPGWDGVSCDLFGPNLAPTRVAEAPADTQTPPTEAPAAISPPENTTVPPTDVPPTEAPALTATPTPVASTGGPTICSSAVLGAIIPLLVLLGSLRRKPD